MKKNIKHFFLLTALAAGTIHFVNRFINMTADIKNILKAEKGRFDSMYGIGEKVSESVYSWFQEKNNLEFTILYFHNYNFKIMIQQMLL